MTYDEWLTLPAELLLQGYDKPSPYPGYVDASTYEDVSNNTRRLLKRSFPFSDAVADILSRDEIQYLCENSERCLCGHIEAFHHEVGDWNHCQICKCNAFCAQ